MSFLDWIIQVEKAARLTQHPEICLARGKAEDIYIYLLMVYHGQ